MNVKLCIVRLLLCARVHVKGVTDICAFAQKSVRDNITGVGHASLHKMQQIAARMYLEEVLFPLHNLDIEEHGRCFCFSFFD